MEKFSSAYFKKLANDIMFDINEKEAEELKEEFQTLQKQIKMLQDINTEGVEEMVYPFEDASDFLRLDQVHQVISQEEALLNVASCKAGHIHVPKVVK